MELNLTVKILEIIVRIWESNYVLPQSDTHSEMVQSKEQMESVALAFQNAEWGFPRENGLLNYIKSFGHKK